MKNKKLSNIRILDKVQADAVIAGSSTTAVKDFISKVKDAGEEDTGTFKVIISTEDVDRHGETILLAGWDLSFFEKNPVVLWAHDYSDLPLGTADKVYKEDKNLVAEGRFAPASANPKAQQVRKLYDGGFLNATSIGCRVLEQDGDVIKRAELLEFSFVPVPANPHALRLNEMGMDVKELVTKGLMLDEEKGEEKQKGAVADEVADKEKRAAKGKRMEKVYQIMWAFANVLYDDETPVDAFDNLLAETVELLSGLISENAEAGDAVENAMNDKEKAKAFSADAVAKAFQMKTVKAAKDIQEEVGAAMTMMQSKIDRIIVETSEAVLAAVGNEEEGEPVEQDEKEPEDEQTADKSFKEKAGRVLSKKTRGILEATNESLQKSTAAITDLLKETETDNQPPEEGTAEDNGDEETKNASPSARKDFKAFKQQKLEREVLQAVNTLTANYLRDWNERRAAKRAGKAN